MSFPNDQLTAERSFFSFATFKKIFIYLYVKKKKQPPTEF